MRDWQTFYNKAHATVKAARTAIERLSAADASDIVIGRICCAGNALDGVRALLDEAGQLQSAPRPRLTLDVNKIFTTARLNRGRKRRQDWDSGTDVFKQLDEIHKANPAEARLLIASLQVGIEQAIIRGLALTTSDRV